MTIDELTQTIQDRIDALHSEIAVLEAARTDLHASGARSGDPAANGSATTGADTNGSGPVARRRRAKPKPPGAQTEVVPPGKLEVMLTQYDGITTAALTKLANGKREQVLAVLRELEAAGRARRTGQRRGTRWHGVTDEDRINARAAELEKQSRQARALTDDAV